MSFETRKDSLSATGSSVAATLLVFVGSACCIGPLAGVFTLVGLSGSTVLLVENTVGPYRPYVLALTVLSLTVGFYAAYRPVAATSCAPGTACARPESRKLQRGFLWFASSLFLVVLYFTYVHPNVDVYFGIYL